MILKGSWMIETHFSSLHPNFLIYIICVLKNLTPGSTVLFRLTLQKTKIDTRAISAFHKAILVFLSLNPETHSLLSLPAPSLSAQDPHY